MWDVRAHVLCKFHAGTPVCRSAAGEKRKKMIVFFRHRDHALDEFFCSKFFYHRMCPGCHSAAHYVSDLHDTPCRGRRPKSAQIWPSIEQKYRKFWLQFSTTRTFWNFSLIVDSYRPLKTPEAIFLFF